jgi:hypothetical protein
MMWFAISIAISITISLLLPFPISLVVIIGVFILLNFYMRKRMMKRMGIRGRGMFGSVFAGNSLNYYCLGCGKKHKETACPNCGSKMKRVGS